MTSFAILGTAWVGLSACNAPGPAGDAPATSPPSGRFGSDLAFLKQHTEVVVLTDPSGARGSRRTRLSGPGHDQHDRRQRRPELRLARADRYRVREEPAAHERLRR